MDRLSYLPNEIQNLILSFLPREDAIRARILSSEWRSAHSSLSKLVFNQSQGDYLDNQLRRKFKNFVDQTLVPEGTHIERVSVYVDIDEEVIFSLDLNRWILIAVQRNVQDLCLWIVSREPLQLPRAFFTWGTLKNLALHHVHLHISNTTFSFPMLKYLTLDKVFFYGDENAMQRLLSVDTCPVLEKLVILYCSKFHTFITCHPRLWYLKLSTCQIGVFSLSIPSLRVIDYTGDPLKICSMTLLSLVNATFQYNAVSFNPPYPIAILSRLNSVCTLIVKTYFIEGISHDENLLASAAMLSLRVKHFYCHIFPTLNQYAMVLFFLNCLEGLETFHINIEELPRDDRLKSLLKEAYEHDVALVQTRRSIYPTLKRVTIKNFIGTESDIHIARVVIMCARACEQLSISFSKQMDPIVQKNIIDELFMHKIDRNLALVFPDLDLK
ncbi:hypothetical protein ACHQM5_020698 [Ranunculus cassubicifolius]